MGVGLEMSRTECFRNGDGALKGLRRGGSYGPHQHYIIIKFRSRKTPYRGFMYVQDAIRLRKISGKFAEYFPQTCEYCGRETIINDSMTVVKCSNPNCSHRIASRALSVFRAMGSSGIGEVFMLEYTRSIHAKSIIDLFRFPPSGCGCLVQESLAIPRVVPDMIKLLNLPNLKEDVSKIFKNINSYEQYFELVNELGYEGFVRSQLGYKNNKRMKSAENYAEILEMYKEDIKGIFDIVPVEHQAEHHIPIVVTGDIRLVKAIDGSKLSREQYVKALNELGIRFNVRFDSTKARQSARFIVADYPSTNESYVVGLERAKHGDNVLITSDQLLGLTKRMAETGEIL